MQTSTSGREVQEVMIAPLLLVTDFVEGRSVTRGHAGWRRLRRISADSVQSRHSRKNDTELVSVTMNQIALNVAHATRKPSVPLSMCTTLTDVDDALQPEGGYFGDWALRTPVL